MKPLPNFPHEPEHEKLPLIAHLRELKRRLIIAVGAFLLASGISYFFAADLYAFLVRPLAESFPDPASRRMIYTSLIEAFFTYLKLAMFAGLFLSFPILAAQFYGFLAPGLYKKERRVLLPYLVAAPVLFAIGAAFCYYLVFPAAWRFFLSFEGGAGELPIQLEAKVSEYLSLVMHLITAFGLSFQLPVLLSLLVQFGLVQVQSLRKGRRYALVIIAVVSAIITPPDVFSQIALIVPLYALYELSIVLCGRIERKKLAVGS